MSRLRGALGAFAVGFAVGVLGLAIEWALSGSHLAPEAVASYGLLGGLAAGFTHAIVGLWRHSTTARLAALAASAPMIALQLGYAVNVRLLPGEHYLSAKSLAADFLALAPLVPLVLLGGTSRLAHAARGALGGATALVGAGLLATSILGLAAAWPSPPRPTARAGLGPDLLLVVMDSVRRDRVGAYGHGRPTSPHFDSQAAEGTLFQDAQAGGPWTVPSVRVLLRRDGHSSPGLAERLAARGYVTACFTDNPHLVRGSEILRGFDHVDRSVGSWRTLIGGTLLNQLAERLDSGSDDKLVRRALDWVATQQGPFFLYVHLMDSHTPYRFPEIDGRRRPGRRIEFPVSFMRLTPDEADGIQARYDGGIRSADAALGRLFGGLRQRSQLLAVVTADHGENLGEAGRWFHGSEPTPERMAVPLLVTGDGVQHTRVLARVEFEAIPAALLAAAGDGPVAGTILDPTAIGDSGALSQPLPPGGVSETGPTGGPSAEARERLRALGYITP